MTGHAHKVMLLGQIGVGKSSIAQRLVFDRFETSYKPTIGVDVYRHEVLDDTTGKSIPMIVWDSDGNLGDAMFRHVYLKEASAAIIVADVTRPDTVEALPNIARAFRERLPGRGICFLLNKVDLTTAPGEDTLHQDLKASGTMLFRTSAMTGENVRQAFTETARAILRRVS